MKKRIVCLVLIAIMVLSGCGNSNVDTSQTDNTESAVDKTAADSDTVIKEVKSDKIVEEYNESEYNFGGSEIVCELPKGFVPSDYEGEYIPKDKKDLSSINQILYDSDEDITKYTKEEYKNKIDSEFSETYGMDISIDVTQYDRIMIDGRPGLYIVYNYDFREQHYDAIVVELYNGKESNIITFLQAPGRDWMEKYAESAKTIRYKDAIENGQ
ncbi:MAG: hypothetical protein K5888_09770 [Lachnospiraceae bacterium]|nr:hypothetical protein [Lachnospiraceae bacterium]